MIRKRRPLPWSPSQIQVRVSHFWIWTGQTAWLHWQMRKCWVGPPQTPINRLWSGSQAAVRQDGCRCFTDYNRRLQEETSRIPYTLLLCLPADFSISLTLSSQMKKCRLKAITFPILSIVSALWPGCDPVAHGLVTLFYSLCPSPLLHCSYCKCWWQVSFWWTYTISSHHQENIHTEYYILTGSTNTSISTILVILAALNKQSHLCVITVELLDWFIILHNECYQFQFKLFSSFSVQSLIFICNNIYNKLVMLNVVTMCFWGFVKSQQIELCTDLELKLLWFELWFEYSLTM